MTATPSSFIANGWPQLRPPAARHHAPPTSQAGLVAGKGLQADIWCSTLPGVHVLPGAHVLPDQPAHPDVFTPGDGKARLAAARRQMRRARRRQGMAAGTLPRRGPVARPATRRCRRGPGSRCARLGARQAGPPRPGPLREAPRCRWGALWSRCAHQAARRAARRLKAAAPAAPTPAQTRRRLRRGSRVTMADHPGRALPPHLTGRCCAHPGSPLLSTHVGAHTRAANKGRIGCVPRAAPWYPERPAVLCKAPWQRSGRAAHQAGPAQPARPAAAAVLADRSPEAGRLAHHTRSQAESASACTLAHWPAPTAPASSFWQTVACSPAARRCTSLCGRLTTCSKTPCPSRNRRGGTACCHQRNQAGPRGSVLSGRKEQGAARSRLQIACDQAAARVIGCTGQRLKLPRESVTGSESYVPGAPPAAATQGAVRHLVARRSRKAAAAAEEGRRPWISEKGLPASCVRSAAVSRCARRLRHSQRSSCC